MTYKLVCFDMDGVIFEDVNFWMELHRRFGTLEEGKRLSEKYLHTDYNKLVEEVVERLWKGKDAKPYYDLVNSIEYLPGVNETFEHIKTRGYMSAIISTSSIDVARRVRDDYGVDHIYANGLVIKDGKVSGEFISTVGAGKENKAKILRDLCSEIGISPEEVIYVGDSESDIEVFKEVGISIAFNSSSEELKKVSHYVADSYNLADVIMCIP